MQILLKTCFFFVSFNLIGCDTFLFQKNLSQNNRLLSLQTKELIESEALDFAKKATWEVSLYLDFQKKEIHFSRDKINVENSRDLVHLGHGSGFFIDPHHMITNFHVIDMANDKVKIISNKDSEESETLVINEMKVLKVSLIYDLALLRSENASDHFIPVRKRAIDTIKDSFFLLGYPGNRFIFSEVFYNGSHLNRNLLLFNRKQELGQLTGASGGPIIDQKGELVAVNQSGSDEIAIGVSHSLLENFLNGNNNDCSQQILEECLKEEWLYLEQIYRSGNQMAKHRLSLSKSYEQWLNKKEKLNQLISQREKINIIEEELVKKWDDFNNRNTLENQNSYEKTKQQYEEATSVYNQIASELNELL